MELALGEPIKDRLLIDKNPSHTSVMPVLIRIFPESRILIALRDPRDVCLSCFMQPLRMGPVSSAYMSLEETVTEYISVMESCKAITSKMKNPWLEIRYEDVVNDLAPAARRVTDFLGVQWDPGVLKFDEHARQKTVRSPTYADVRKPVFKTAVGRWRNYQKYFDPHLKRLEPFAKAYGYE